MPLMIRTRRQGGSLSSLPSYNDHELPCCPSSVPVDESSSSDFEDDDIYPVKVVESYPLCRVPNNRQKRLAWRAFLVRAVMVVFIFATVGLNLSSKFDPRSKASARSRITKVVPTEAATPADNNARVARRLTVEEKQVFTPKNLANEAKIRHNSMNLIIERFGKGPHLVEFELVIWEGVKPTMHFFTIEMAPTHLMSASVYLFLQQVASGLWSGTSFYMNADHVIAARPVSGNGQLSKRDLFEKSGLNSLPFAEHTEAYPHLPYTLGFVGRGPDFYINKNHNFHHDPCFANVVIGRPTINKVAAMRVYDKGTSRIRPVDIVSARIVNFVDLSEKATEEYLVSTLR